MTCAHERVNTAIAITILAMDLAIFVGPALLERHLFGLFVIALLAFVLATPAHWGLVHEGIHGRLLIQPVRNRIASRLLAALLGFSFDVVQFGHLMHHRYNGHEYDRPDRIKAGEPLWLSLVRHYGHLLGGHYLLTASAGTLAFAPIRALNLILKSGYSGNASDMIAIRRAALKWFSNRGRLLRIRVDTFLSLVIIALEFKQYGPWWPVLLLALRARAVVYSTLDNLPHYGSDGRGEKSAANLTLPGWASLLVLNHNFHGIHHEHPDLSWNSVAEQSGKVNTDGSYLAAVIHQFRGPTRY